MKSFKQHMQEAEYQGKKVTLNKPFSDSSVKGKKKSVYVRGKNGKVKKVSFGDPKMSIKKGNPDRKRSYCARSKGIKGGGTDKTKTNYWSRKAWDC